MTISRRGFLRKASMLGVAAAIPGWVSRIAYGQQSTAGSSLKSLSKNLAKLKMTDFHKQLNTEFRISVRGFGLEGAKSKWVDTALIDVRDLAASSEEGVEVFSLLFRGPADVSLPQDTYTVKHDVLGKFRLFIVPADPDLSGLKYQADFNRFAPTE